MNVGLGKIFQLKIQYPNLLYPDQNQPVLLRLASPEMALPM